jgi:hypothetical protein
MQTPKSIRPGNDSMQVAEVVRRRLASQFLTTTSFRSGSEVVRALGAVQAQDYAGAKWALAQRTVGVSDADVEAELSDGRILRTHVLRPTWHFVAPDDIRWMLALTAPRVKAAMAFNARWLELDDAVFRRSNAALARALAGGKRLTREELKPMLEQAGVKVITGQRLAHIMLRAELDAVVCSGERRGNQFTYALLDERVAPAPSRERDDTLLDLTLRYFTTRGPATPADFAWWSGLSMADAKRGLEIAGRALEQITIGDQKYWLGAASKDGSRVRTAHLLPNYDEYFIGFKDRSAIAQRLGSAKTVTGINALTGHVVVVDGQIVGGWKRTFDKKTIRVDLSIQARLTGAEEKRVAAAASRFGEFLGVPSNA